jgi:Flp pilus assembly protein TadD
LTECAREFQTLGRNDLALKVSEMTVHFDPRNGKGWDLFAQLEAQRKNFSAALLGFQKAVSLEPGNAAFVANLGVILDAMGDAQGARKYFQRALELNPALNQARKRLEALNAKHVGPS